MAGYDPMHLKFRVLVVFDTQDLKMHAGRRMARVGSGRSAMSGARRRRAFQSSSINVFGVVKIFTRHGGAHDITKKKRTARRQSSRSDFFNRIGEQNSSTYQT